VATAAEARALGKQPEVGRPRRQRQALLLGVLGVAVFGLTLSATRLAVADFDPLFVTLGRSLAALAGLTLLWARPPPPARRDWPRLAAFALFAIIGFPLLMAVAIKYAPASHGVAVLPLLTAMSGALLAGERPSVGFWACAVAGTGSALVYSLLSGSGSGALKWADVAGR
jgi:drug/metabolite transporter (DMT)-like permease